MQRAIRLSYGMVSESQPILPDADGGGLSAFEARWLAEAVRLREAHGGALDDHAAVAAARAAGGALEDRILCRAACLGARSGLAAALRAWRPRARMVMVVLGAFAVAGGFGTALAVLGDGSRAVNVVWALGGLLGVHLLSLLLWLAGLGLGTGEAGGAIGRAWLWLSARSAPGPAQRYLVEALGGILARARLARWWLGTVTHGLWLGALAGALAGLLAALAVRRYGFVWETTILPSEAFIRFVAMAGWLPAQLGFAVPDAAAVRASGAHPAPDEAVRIAWSSWLVGCVVVYGLAPRLVLWASCLALWRSGRARLRLDLAAPGFALLAARLVPASERIGVVDAAPAHRHRAHIGAHPAAGSAVALAVGLELGHGAAWPPALPAGAGDGGVIDTGAERRRLLARVSAAPPGRLLIACDARLSPDRGSLELITECCRHAGACRVWLWQAGAPAGRERGAHWREALLAIDLAPDQVVEGEAAALAWLGGADDALPAAGAQR